MFVTATLFGWVGALVVADEDVFLVFHEAKLNKDAEESRTIPQGSSKAGHNA
jgi:hypothetical protein